MTHLIRPWCWERLKAGGEGDDRGWDGWMAPPIQWTWVWASSRNWWGTGRPGVLQSIGSQRIGHDWATELNWTALGGGFFTTSTTWEAQNLWLSSVQFSHSVMSDSLQAHGLQHTRLPCPSPIPGAYSNSCPLNWWCHPTISSSVAPFSSCLQSCPASGSFPMKSVLCIRWPKYWSFSFSTSPSNEYLGLISFRTDWFALLAVQGTLKSLL